MPQIIVMADKATDRADAPVMMRERVNVSDFESDHFAAAARRASWLGGQRRPRSRAGQDRPLGGVGRPGGEASAQPPAKVVTTAS